MQDIYYRYIIKLLVLNELKIILSQIASRTCINIMLKVYSKLLITGPYLVDKNENETAATYKNNNTILYYDSFNKRTL